MKNLQYWSIEVGYHTRISQVENSASITNRVRRRLKASFADRSRSPPSEGGRIRFPDPVKHPLKSGTGSISSISPVSYLTSLYLFTLQLSLILAPRTFLTGLSSSWTSPKVPTWDMPSSGLSSLGYWALATLYLYAGKRSNRL